MAGSFNPSAWARGPLFIAAAIACVLIAAGSASAATGGAGAAPRDSCPPLPGSFAPGSGNFTMMIRINQMDNVKTYTNFNSATGGLGGRIRQQDIFVINSRFDQTTPTVAQQIASSLRASFPCNRIISLNGLSPDSSQPGFLGTLIGSPSYMYAIMLDYEPNDWADAQAQGLAIPAFTVNFRPNLGRLGYFLGQVNGALSGLGVGTRVGSVPFDQPNWNYGQIGQTADAFNTRLGARHLGLQSVQTQGACTGRTAFGNRVAAVRDQYKFRTKYRKKKIHRGKKKTIVKRIPYRVKIKKAAQANTDNLAVQVSFTDAPEPGNSMPILATSAGLADNCVATGLAKGQSTFFFFASDSAMKLLFAQPTVNSLRPAVS
jgi:hypothetical protein